ncbi:hypothetical protein [Microbacterium sp.]|uniref:hypothetical protein n=1 Tax=Microbacterium sp. TaxID=51671 RepID=UPI003A8814E1
MSIMIDSRGNRHLPAGLPGGGQFTTQARTAPTSALTVDEDDFFEADWHERMQAVIDAGDPGDSGVTPTMNLLDPDTWEPAPF